jgi:hypothetical protein
VYRKRVISNEDLKDVGKQRGPFVYFHLHPNKMPPIEAINTAFTKKGESRDTCFGGSIPKNVEKLRTRCNDFGSS